MECGDCTLCCDLLPVKWLQKPVNTVCKYCDKGCMIHETKEEECKEFNCMYAQVEDIPLELRPDKSHVIFEKHSDSSIVATLDARFKMTPIAERQIKALNFLQNRKTIFSSDYQKNLNTTERTAQRDLQELIKKGLILKKGKGKSTQYYMK